MTACKVIVLQRAIDPRVAKPLNPSVLPNGCSPTEVRSTHYGSAGLTFG